METTPSEMTSEEAMNELVAESERLGLHKDDFPDKEVPPIDVVTEAKKPQFHEGQVLSVNYTVRGPVHVVWRGGQQVVEEPKPNPAFVLPQSLSRKDTINFIRFCLLADQIAQQGNRNVPLLVREAEYVVPKAAIKKFRNMELVVIQTLQMEKEAEKGKRDIQSHAFCWLTPNGMGLRDALKEAARQEDEKQKAYAEAVEKVRNDPEHQKKIQELEEVLAQTKFKTEAES